MINISNIFDENIFNEKSITFWKSFKRNQHGLKLTYLYLREIHKEKVNGDFNREFLTSIRELHYRSGISGSQLKKHIRALIIIQLLERRLEKNITTKDDKKEYKSESYYKIKLLNDENLKKALELEVLANIQYYNIQYKRSYK